MNKKLTIVALPLLLVACSSPIKYNDPTSNYVAPEIANSVDQIIQTEARQSTAVQKQLAMVQTARTPVAPATNPNAGAPTELLTQVTELNWSGPVDALLKSLAQKVGYTYKAPMASLGYDMPIVNIDIKNETVAQALDAISYQIQQRIQVVVDPSTKTFSLRPNGTPKEFLPTFNEKTPKKQGVKKHRRVYTVKSTNS